VNVRKLCDAKPLECFRQTGQGNATSGDFYILTFVEKPVSSSPKRDRALSKLPTVEATACGRLSTKGRPFVRGRQRDTLPRGSDDRPKLRCASCDPRPRRTQLRQSLRTIRPAKSQKWHREEFCKNVSRRHELCVQRRAF
jgi:hypothetical protein